MSHAPTAMSCVRRADRGPLVGGSDAHANADPPIQDIDPSSARSATMGACASRPSDDGASTSGSSKKSKAGKPGSDASTNPARVVFRRGRGILLRAIGRPRVLRVPPGERRRDSAPRCARSRRRRRAGGAVRVRGRHRPGRRRAQPYDDDVRDAVAEALDDAGRRRGADAFDDIGTVESRFVAVRRDGVSRRGDVGGRRIEASAR